MTARTLSALTAVCAIAIGTAGRPSAQSGARFEVVSIKPTAPGTYPREPWPSLMQSQPTGRFRGMNVTIELLVRQAYWEPGALRPPELVNPPGWTTTDKYEVDARFAALASQAELNAQLAGMLRAMLEDRCRLQAHVETRTLPAYALVRARTDGRLGPNLHVTTTDCDAYLKEARDGRQTLQAMAAGNKPPCDFIGTSGARTTGRGRTMAAFAAGLSSAAGRYVVDDTGLEGRFDYELEYARDPLAQSDLPTIFTALPEQLGLKLESRPAPQPVIVIDRIERPRPD